MENRQFGLIWLFGITAVLAVGFCLCLYLPATEYESVRALKDTGGAPEIMQIPSPRPATQDEVLGRLVFLLVAVIALSVLAFSVFQEKDPPRKVVLRTHDDFRFGAVPEQLVDQGMKRPQFKLSRIFIVTAVLAFGCWLCVSWPVRFPQAPTYRQAPTPGQVLYRMIVLFVAAIVLGLAFAVSRRKKGSEEVLRIDP